MTENKRFEIKPSAMYNNKYVIHDSKKKYTFPVLDSTLNYMFCKALNELNDEKEAWKQSCCSNSNFNSILLHELDIAQEQGFEVSNPFKQFLEDRGDVE